MLKGFKEFLLRGNVIDLAVAVVVGGAFSLIVAALVKDILTPLIAAIVGKQDFSNLYFTINSSRFMYGDFINAVINFAFVAAAIYFFVVVPVKKVTELQARRRAAGEPADEATPISDEVLLLTEIRDALQAQRS
jgi:large conductance mechanosensitive channel